MMENTWKRPSAWLRKLLKLLELNFSVSSSVVKLRDSYLDVLWYGMVWYGMVWYGIVSYRMVWYIFCGEVIIIICHQAGKEVVDMKSLKKRYM